ncbi:MAG: hypothetical protein HY770_00080, partial [Chitinivibrionia bacterium]|nr:hypothetical protein [Chitinivibrionia bacterium]
MSGFVCIFEDKKFSNFFPISLSRPVFELRIGFQNLRLRLLDELAPPSHGILCRDYLADIMRIEYPDLSVNEWGDNGPQTGAGDPSRSEILFVNGRLLCFGDELPKLIASIPQNGIGIKGGYVVAAKLRGSAAEDFARYIRMRVSEEAIDRLCAELKGCAAQPPGRSEGKSRKKAGDGKLPQESSFEDAREVGNDGLLERIPQALGDLIRTHSVAMVDMQTARLLSFPWQMIEESGRVIEDDFNKLALRGQGEEAIVFPGVHMVGEENIVIGEATVIKPGVVLDASAGPIVIGDGTLIMANATLTGPVCIGKQSLIRAGAKILEGTSVGDVCKVGGEVDGTIFASHANKQHDGFIGHSYVGEWVNIGAGSNNSDLKNNYSPVRMWCAGSVRETGRQFLGFILGDH